MKTTKSLPPLSTQRALSWTWQIEDGLVLPGNAETRSKSVVLHAPRPDRAIDPKILDSYVGGYEVAPGLVVKAPRAGNQLLGQAGGHTPTELLRNRRGSHRRSL